MCHNHPTIYCLTTQISIHQYFDCLQCFDTVGCMSERPSIISCFIKIQNGFTFLVLAYAQCPGEKAIKQVPVYQYMYASVSS